MRIARDIMMIVVATMVATTVPAQIRIIPREVRDSVANPPTHKCDDMHFVEGHSIDFGTMEEDGGTQTKKIVWRNQSKEPLTITRITTSCGCVRCDYAREAVESENQGEIVITYSPKGHPGTMRHRIFLYTDRSVKMPTAIVDIKGYVKASADRRGDYPHAIGALLLRSREIRFDRAESGVQVIRIACMNGGKRDLSPKKDVLLSSKNISLDSEPITLRAGEEGEIIIRYTPTQGDESKPLRLFVDEQNTPPRNREIKIVTQTTN